MGRESCQTEELNKINSCRVLYSVKSDSETVS